MNNFKYFLLLIILLGFITLSCEKDDICAETTATTPSLIIEFFDVSNPENSKNVVKFRAQGIDNDVLPDYNIVTANSVILPLKTNEISTQFSLYKDFEIDDNGTPDDESDDFNTGNEDIITISYSTEEVYVSRACGYKTTYKNVTIIVEDDSDTWIEFIQSVNDNQTIENETTAHFNFFH